MEKQLARIFDIISNYKKSYKLYGRWSSEKFVDYLRANGVQVGENARFRYPKRTIIDLNRPWLITIGCNCDFNDNFALMTHDFMTSVFRECYHDFVPGYAPVKIGDNCTFGRNVLVTRGTEIGNNCCIGAGSIVTRSIPDNSLAAGIPCKKICYLEEYYLKRKSECKDDAIQIGVEYFNRFGKLPPMNVLFEEWTLFLDKDDVNRHPEMRKHIDFRLNNHYDEFFRQQILTFNGYEGYIEEVKNRLNLK